MDVLGSFDGIEAAVVPTDDWFSWFGLGRLFCGSFQPTQTIHLSSEEGRFAQSWTVNCR